MENLLKILIIYLMCLLITSCTDKNNSNNNIVENKIPKCAIIFPNTGLSFPKGTNIEIKIRTKDDDGIIERIKIFIDSSLILNSDKLLENFNWDTKDMNYGCHAIKILVQDDRKGKDS